MGRHPPGKPRALKGSTNPGELIEVFVRQPDSSHVYLIGQNQVPDGSRWYENSALEIAGSFPRRQDMALLQAAAAAMEVGGYFW